MRNPLKRGVVTFVFDDGYQKVHENALPVLDTYRLPGVFAVPIDGSNVENSNHRFVKIPQSVRPWQRWLPISERGHEIVAHSATHVDLRKLPDEKLQYELKAPKDLLKTSSFVYPGGAHDDRVVAATKKYYKFARTVLRGFETIQPRDPWRLKTFNYSRNNFRVWKANLFVLWAWLTDKWIIETYHMIDDDDSQMVHTVKTKEFNKHIAFVSLLPIEVKTFKEIIEI